jgi:hypothetical protein
MAALDADGGRAESPQDPQRRLRDERFAELINYALRRLGAERGAVLGAQNELAASLHISSTMLHRYKTGGADFDALKARTVAQLAKVIDFDITSVYIWVESGREAALEHQRLLSQRPVAFSALELARELVRLLERYGSALDEPTAPPPPQLQCQALMEFIRQKREPAPELFDELAAILTLTPVLEAIEAGGEQELNEVQWGGLAKLLGRPVSTLQEQFLL